MRRGHRVDHAAGVARPRPADGGAGGARARRGRAAVRRARGRLERTRQLGLHPRRVELAEDLRERPGPCTVVYACGTAAPAPGLIMGAKLAGFAARGIRVAGVNVCDDRAYFVAAMSGSARTPRRAGSSARTSATADFDLVDGHVGLGYAKSRPEELATIREVCRSDGVVLDPVYTGKAFHGVVTELRRDATRFGGRRSRSCTRAGCSGCSVASWPSYEVARRGGDRGGGDAPGPRRRPPPHGRDRAVRRRRRRVERARDVELPGRETPAPSIARCSRSGSRRAWSRRRSASTTRTSGSRSARASGSAAPRSRCTRSRARSTSAATARSRAPRRAPSSRLRRRAARHRRDRVHRRRRVRRRRRARRRRPPRPPGRPRAAARAGRRRARGHRPREPLLVGVDRLEQLRRVRRSRAAGSPARRRGVPASAASKPARSVRRRRAPAPLGERVGVAPPREVLVARAGRGAVAARVVGEAHAAARATHSASASNARTTSTSTGAYFAATPAGAGAPSRPCGAIATASIELSMLSPSRRIRWRVERGFDRVVVGVGRERVEAERAELERAVVVVDRPHVRHRRDPAAGVHPRDQRRAALGRVVLRERAVEELAAAVERARARRDVAPRVAGGAGGAAAPVRRPIASSGDGFAHAASTSSSASALKPAASRRRACRGAGASRPRGPDRCA